MNLRQNKEKYAKCLLFQQTGTQLILGIDLNKRLQVCRQFSKLKDRTCLGGYFFDFIDSLMSRILLFSLLCCFSGLMVHAQEPLPPAEHGGDLNRIINLRDSTQTTLIKSPYFDFDRDNPNMRALVPLSRNCMTVEVEESLSAEHHESEESLDEFESWLSESIQQSRQKTRGLRTRPAVHTIPMVVHVISSRPVENISDEQIFSQIEALNQDFRRLNPDQEKTPKDFRGLAVDTQIEFCLASVDPSGQLTNGINRVSLSGAPFTEGELNQIIKPNTIWDPNRYLNVWVCNLSGGILGFAQFPSSSGLTGIPNGAGTANTDGVVCNYMAFGTMGTAAAPFNKGRTLTHEMGHWLGLRHIWGDGPCEQDDYCADTPPAADAHFQCPPATTLACDGTRAMVQNFMDYSDDECMNLFTANQKERMRAVLENSPRRKTLLNSQVCGMGKTPTEPDFVADVRAGGRPLSVVFSPQLEEVAEVSQYQWTFPGGRPSSSTKANPKVTYRQPGRYNVSLRILGPGGSRSIEKTGYVQVYENGVNLPLSLKFEKDSLAPGFYFRNPNRDLGWEQSPQVGARGKSSGSLKIANIDNNYINSADWLMTPVMDFTNGTQTTLSFDLAYTSYGGRYADTLGIFIATESDGVFRNIYYKGGDRLRTAEPYNKEFIPRTEEWRTERIDLSEFEAYEKVQIAIVNFSGYGNNLYLDNLKIASIPKPAPEPSFLVSDTLLCPGDTIQFADRSKFAPDSWVWTFPGGFPASDTTANPEVVYEKAGVYDVLLTVSNRFGTQTLTRSQQIIVQEKPALRLAASKNEICPGEVVTLNTNLRLPDLRWNLSPGDSLPLDTFALVSPAQDFVYQVSAQGDFVCPAIAEASVRVDRGRELKITPPKATICEGASLVLNATGADAYRWLIAPGIEPTTSGRAEVRPTETTTYSVIGTTRTGCEVKKDVTVEVKHQVESVQIRADKLRVCPGETVNIRASGATSYQWFPATSLNTTEGAEIIAAPLEDITYRLTATTEEGCISRSQISLQMGKPPVVQAFASVPEICEGDEISLDAMGAMSYRWYPEQDLIDLDGQFVRARPQQTTLFNVIGENELGCKDTASVLVNVFKPTPIKIEPENPTICRGRSVILKASGGTSYTWSGPALNAIYRPQVNANPQEDAVYRVTGVDARGCRSTAETQVKVNQGQMPTADFAADAVQICAGLPVQYRHQASNAASFFWEFPGGVPATSTDPNPQVVYQEQGAYDVVLTVQGCDGTTDRRSAVAFMVVTAPLDLQLNVGSDITVCKGAPTALEASGATEYEWSPAIGLSDTKSERIIATPEISTTYTLKARNRDGCETSREFRLNVVGGGSTLKVAPFGATICAGESIDLEASGAFVYRWSPAAGLDATDRAKVSASPRVTTDYVVEATDLNGCVFRDTLKVRVSPNPKIVLSHENPSICKGEQLELSAGAEGVISWTPDFGLSAITGQTVTAFPKETTTYTISCTNSSGCQADTQLTLTVRAPLPLTVKTQDKAICPGMGTLLTASEGYDRYQWSPAIGLNTTTGQMVTASPKKTTTYTVKTEGEGCNNTANVTVEVLQTQALNIMPPAARICKGESLPLEVSGGQDYIWDANEGLNTVAGALVTVTPQVTSSYTVRSLDSLGCETSGSVTVLVSEVDFLEVSTSAAQVCEGDEVTLRASGAVTYEWLPAPELETGQISQTFARPTQNRTYQVIGVDSVGCLDTASVAISVNQLVPNMRLSTTRIDLAASGGLVQFNDLTENAKEWAWAFGDGSFSQDRKPIHIYTEAGTYEVVMRVSDGICVGEMRQEIVIENTSSLIDLADEGLLRVAPADSGIVELNLESPRPMYLRMRVLDEQGTMVLDGSLRLEEGAYRQQLNLGSMGPGEYRVQLTDGKEIFNQFIRI
jgi:PKD repeat protein